jgi:hypothetical protein
MLEARTRVYNERPMNLRTLFDVFSRRPGRAAAIPLKPLTPEFRNRVLMLCRDRFSATQHGDYRNELWTEMHSRFAYLLGRTRLSNSPDGAPQIEDLLRFLAMCSNEHFLDFLEFVFQTESYFRASPDENAMVDEINHFLLLDDLPYAVTPFVRETRTQQFRGHSQEVRALVSAPKVVLREHQVVHAEAVVPAIELLADRGFSSANQEYLAALEDYRKGRYSDCLTKCGSAFESTMKLICDRRQWTYQQTDAAAALLRIIMMNSELDSYFEQPLLLVAIMRNRLSSSHGAGAQPRAVPAHRARYALNATAAAILLLVEECT